MKRMTILFLSLLMAGCDTTGPTIYGQIDSRDYVVAQLCFKDPNADINQAFRYSILFNNNDYIRTLPDTNIKNNGYPFYDLALGEKKDLVAFLLPYDFKNIQNFGFGWDLLKIKTRDSKWTSWLEPQFTVKDISTTDFKINHGLIGRKDKNDENVSPYLVRFKNMDMQDYIQKKMSHWKDESIPDCHEGN